MLIGFLVNRYKQDQYEISTTLAIEESQNPLSTVDGALDIGFNFGGSGIVETRIAVLKSYAHNLRVAQSLGGKSHILTKDA